MTHDEKCREASERFAKEASEKVFPRESDHPSVAVPLKRVEFEASLVNAFTVGFREGLMDALRRESPEEPEGAPV